MTPEEPSFGSLPRLGAVGTGEAGVGLVQFIAAIPREEGGLGWVFRPQPNADVGIDGHLEVINQATGEATGRITGVQVKAGPSYFEEVAAEGWIIRVRRATVEYWRNYAVPVLLVLVDISARVAYWASVSKTDFPLVGDNYKVLVPRANCFDATSAEQITAIARQAPPSLATRIGLPGQLAKEEQLVRRALREASSADEHYKAAEQAVSFANALQTASRPYDAAFIWRDGVVAFIRAGQRDRALTSLAALMSWLVRDLREAELALTICRDALGPQAPGGRAIDPWESGLWEGVKADLIEAYAQAVCGTAEGALRAVGRLAASPVAGGTASSLQQASAVADLSVAAALTREDHLAASRAYADLAETLLPSEQPGALLRSRLHAGLADNAEEQIRLIANSPYAVEYAIDRSLCIAWLRLKSQDFEGAREDFLTAAETAVLQENPYAALRAFRNAERCERMARMWPVGIDSTGQRAQSLEAIAAQSSGNRVTHARLMSRVDNRLARGELRQAYIGLREAAFYAWHDLDPAAYEDVQVRYAAVARAAAIEAPSPEFILEGVRATAQVYSALDRRETENNLEAFRELLNSRLVPSFSTEVWGRLEETAQNPQHVAGVLALAKSVGDGWRFPGRDARIASLVKRGLEGGFTRDREGPAAEAVGLVLTLDPELTGPEAATVRDALAGLLDGTPWNHISGLLDAIAVTSANSPTPMDGGDQLVSTLLAFEANASKNNATPEWLGALAMLHRSATGKARDRLADELFKRASGVTGGATRRWYAVERALAGSIGVPEELADRYLTGMAEVLEALRLQTRASGLGGGASDIDALTRWAASRASDDVRQRALRAAIAFLTYPEHLLYERVGWIPFIAHLARETPALVQDAVEALLGAASGALGPSGDFDAFTNPFAFFRVKDHTLAGLRAHGIKWVSTLIHVADEQGRRQIIDALAEASRDGEPDVRLAAAVGAGWAVGGAPDSEVGRLLSLTVLVPLTQDRVATVALAAYRAMSSVGSTSA